MTLLSTTDERYSSILLSVVLRRMPILLGRTDTAQLSRYVTWLRRTTMYTTSKMLQALNPSKTILQYSSVVCWRKYYNRWKRGPTAQTTFPPIWSFALDIALYDVRENKYEDDHTTFREHNTMSSSTQADNPVDQKSMW